MNILELITLRRSVRLFANRPVERADLLAVLEAGRQAPSACNNQPLKFVVVTEPEELDKLAETYSRSWFRTAPAVIVVCVNHQEAWQRGDGKDHGDIDAAIAVDHITLAAAERGLGTCWICAFDPDKLKQLLAQSDSIEPVVVLPIGHPKEPLTQDARQSSRKSMETLVQWGIKPCGDA